MTRLLTLGFGVASYAVFFASFLYLVGFLGNVGVPKSIDSGPAPALGGALLVDTALLLLFGLQHSVMARPRFKAWWTRLVPARDRAQRVRARVERGAGRHLRAVAADPGGRVVGAERRRQHAAHRALLRRRRPGALRDVPDRPLRSLRPAPGDVVFPQPRVPRAPLQAAVPLSLDPPPALRGLDHHVLGDAADERGTFPLRAGDDGIHLRRHPDGGARSRGAARRTVSPLAHPHAGIHSRASGLDVPKQRLRRSRRSCAEATRVPGVRPWQPRHRNDPRSSRTRSSAT